MRWIKYIKTKIPTLHVRWNTEEPEPEIVEDVLDIGMTHELRIADATNNLMSAQLRLNQARLDVERARKKLKELRAGGTNVR